MLATAFRHGLPLSSSSSHQSNPPANNPKKQKNITHSAPPTPSNAHRPATASGAPASSIKEGIVALPVRPLTASTTHGTSTATHLPPSVPLSFPSPLPSPVSSQPTLHLAMPAHSFASSLSPLSSGLPSPTLPPLPPACLPNTSSQPIPITAAFQPAHARSPVINIGSAPPASPRLKDDFDFRIRKPLHQHSVRPSHHRQYSVSSSSDSSSPCPIGSGSLRSPSSPSSPLSVRSRGSSTTHEDVLAPGDRVGAGLCLQGEVLRRVDLDRPVAPTTSNANPDSGLSASAQWDRDLDGMLGLRSDGDKEDEKGGKKEPASEFEVVRRLGAGSYAVVYLVREVLSHPLPGILDGLNDAECQCDDDDAEVDDLDLDGFGHGFWDDDECIDGNSDEFSSDAVDEDGLDLDAGRWRECAVRGQARRDRKKKNGKQVYYGREYAVKVLSKAGMDEEALEAQLVEANIHQSLPAHPNIVTLYRTLETSSLLLLVLEFVPGEDLFYFLEQARDHYEPEPPSSNSSGGHLPNKSTTDVSVLSINTMNTTRTPPTPSLLSTLNEKQLLSKRRLKLIASMFAQMCEAVAVCHDVGVYHRDIKPENFIVTDGWEDERRSVVVKLTDFGLSTRDAASSDMDCGSAPYMSYECRNNCAPTYAPRGADVWSLGIVLINMLYHINPWTDTTQGVCPSFSSFLADPEHFFMQRFAGMVPLVASFLAHRVFCVLPSDDSMDNAGRRASARDFARWVKELPHLMASDGPVGVPLALVKAEKVLAAANEEYSPVSPTSPISPTAPSSSLLAQSLAQVLAQQEAAAATGAAGPSSPAWRHRRGLSNASVGYSLSSVPQSRRPASRQTSFSVADASAAAARMHALGFGIGSAGPASAAGSRAATPLLRGRALPRLGSAGPVSRAPSGSCEPVISELSTVFDEGEGEMSSVFGNGAAALGLRLEPVEQESSLDLDRDEHEQDQENEHDHDQERDESVSRSQSMVRKRKRGARRGKGQIIQQQQQEIARLQQQQQEMAMQLQQLKQQQQTVLQQLPPAVQQQVQQVPPVVPVIQVLLPPPPAGDSLDTLASASEALARELSRTSRSAGQNRRGPSMPVSPPVHVHTHPHAHNLPHAVPHAVPQTHVHGVAAPIRPIPGARDSSPMRVSFPSNAHTDSNANANSQAAVYASSIVASSVSADSSSAEAGSGGPAVSAPTPTIVKKTSKWKLSFGKSSNANHSRSPLPAGKAQAQAPAGIIDINRDNTLSANAKVDAQQQQQLEAGQADHLGPSGSAQLSFSPSTSETWSRGRRPAANTSPWGPSTVSVNSIGSTNSGQNDRWPPAERNVSPNSTRTGRGGPSSSASSIAHSSVSSNWRSSTLTTSSGSSAASAFTRYSNGSVRSVSTAATSVSGGSWRNPSSASLASAERKPGHAGPPSIATTRNSDKSSLRAPPPNVKIMTGVPWALDELPRQLHPNPSGDIFGQPPAPRKQRVRKPKDLPTINERPSHTRSPLSQRVDAARSVTELQSEGRSSRDGFGGDDMSCTNGRDGDRADGTPRKVQKGQINALAKMLSALRR